MRPVSLTLRGFIGTYMGIGKEEIHLDLSGLSGLVAFDGKIGRGKTTILENLHPYRCLASRKGALQHHVYLRDSRKEYVFDLNGRRYHTLVKIDAKSQRQEGYIWEDDVPQVSGKNGEYDRYIENLLGSPKLFFESAFAAQGSKSIASMNESDLKKLFVEFLPIEKLVEYAETAKQAGNTIQSRIDAIKQRIASAERQVAGRPGLEKELSEKDNQLALKKTGLQDAQTQIDSLLSELDKAKTAAAEHQSAEIRRKELAKEKDSAKEKIGSLNAAWDKLKADTDRKVDSARMAIAEKEAAMEGHGKLTAMKAELSDIDKELPKKERALEKIQREIEHTQKTIEEKNRALNDLVARSSRDAEKEQATINDLSEQIRNTEKAINDISGEIKSLQNDSELTRLAYQIEALDKTAAKKDMLPVECDQGVCPFIGDARKAEVDIEKVRADHKKRQVTVQHRLGRLNAELHRKQQDRWLAGKQIEQAKTRKEKITRDCSDEKKAINAQIVNLSKTRDGARTSAQNFHAEIRRIKKRQSELRAGIDGMPNYDTLVSEIKALKERVGELTDGLDRQQKEHARQLGELRLKISQTDAAIATLPLNPEADRLARQKAAELEAARKSEKSLDGEVKALQSEIAVLRHRIAECNKTEQEIASDRRVADKLAHEVAEWRYIQYACGRDGLQALEIDGTAPLIAESANELLTATSGPGATVGFRTIDDEGKECLDIVVYRDNDLSDRGTLLDNLSGGQQIWIMKALRLAMTLVAKQKSGSDIVAALSDEEDGSLDTESARVFISLYNEFMASGGFELCLYVTHREECKAMADHVIRLTDTDIEIDPDTAVSKAA